MLNPTRKPKRSANRDGSVLLAVVVMTMVVLCLATICLFVVQYTTKATSRNVQRTQAKITAEAALTEFIEGYRQSQKDKTPPVTDEKLYEELKSIAALGTAANPVTYQVGLSGESNDEFAQNYGATNIKLYALTSTSFKVMAETTFVTQTQTASVTFTTSAKVKPHASNTIESKKGTAVSNDVQWSMPVEGNLIYENDDGKMSYKEISRSNIYGHVLISKMNFTYDDQTSIWDLYNKSGDNVFKKKERYFWQAPTLTVDGYMCTGSNYFYMGTDVGKSDDQYANSSYYDTATDYPHNGALGNYDGYVCIFQKLVAVNAFYAKIGVTKTNTGTVSNANKPIDVYTHGIYAGSVFASSFVDSDGDSKPDSVTSALDAACTGTGIANFSNDINTICSGFDYRTEYLSASDRSERICINGNFYSYVDPDLNAVAVASAHSGDMVITASNSNSSGGRQLYTTGDIFTNGNIYVYDGANTYNANMLECDGTLHCSGTIYWYNGTKWTAFTSAEYNSLKAGTRVHGIKCKTFDTDVNQTGRNMMPTKGYIAYTGEGMGETTYVKLSEAYDGASSNDIFTMSTSKGNGNVLQPKAQEISSKYADAMTRDSDSTFICKDGTEKRVMNTYDKNEGIKQINASIKLTTDQINYKDPVTGKPNKYVVNVTNKDIVIALPISLHSSTKSGEGQNFSGKYYCDIGCQFKIFVENAANVNAEVSEDQKPHYVYFMFYYEPDPTQCLYLNSNLCNSYSGLTAGTDFDLTTTDGTTYTVKPANIYVGDIKTDDADLITAVGFNTPPAGYTAGDPLRRQMGIFFDSNCDGDSGGRQVWVASDYRVLTTNKSLTLSSTDAEIHAAVVNSFNDGFSAIPASSGQTSMNNQYVPNSGRNADNFIMWMIPDYCPVMLKADSGFVGVQGVIYAWNSQVGLGTTGSNFRIVGQLKCDRYAWYYKNFTTAVGSENPIIDLPMGMSSLMSYSNKEDASAGTTDKIEIQYYEY